MIAFLTYSNFKVKKTLTEIFKFKKCNWKNLNNILRIKCFVYITAFYYSMTVVSCFIYRNYREKYQNAMPI